jgi:flavin-dependent dehydrogenase
VGLNIDFNTRFVGIEKNGSRCLVETDRGDRYADIVIGADGANSQVRKVLNLKESVRSLRGVQFRIHHRVQHKNFVQVHIRNPFFAWVIPENKDTVRTGIISDNPYHDLLEFLSERNINGRIIEKFAGVVPLGRCATQKGSVALVGDAGCQIKPLTYGGIYYGMRCAEVLADCIVNNRLSRYEQEWNQRYGRELKIGFRVRQMLDRLNPENMKSIFSLLKKDAKVLESFIDFENHSKIISAIIKNPSLQKLVGKIFINIMKDFPMSLLS